MSPSLCLHFSLFLGPQSVPSTPILFQVNHDLIEYKSFRKNLYIQVWNSGKAAQLCLWTSAFGSVRWRRLQIWRTTKCLHCIWGHKRHKAPSSPRYCLEASKHAEVEDLRRTHGDITVRGKCLPQMTRVSESASYQSTSSALCTLSVHCASLYQFSQCFKIRHAVQTMKLVLARRCPHPVKSFLQPDTSAF